MKITVLKVLIALGIHGIRHQTAILKLFKWMHDNGLGV